MPSAELIGACQKLARSLSAVGVYKDVVNSASLGVNPQLTSQQVDAVKAYITHLNDILTVLPAGELTTSGIRVSVEEACSKFHMEFPDRSFLNNLDEGDVVEIFTREHVQIFASPNIFKLTSYDIWALAVMPWTDLFSRPDEASSHLKTLAQCLVSEAIPFVKAEMDEHVVREIHLNHKREFYYRLKCAGCLVEKQSRHVVGYASIISARRKK